MPVSRPRPTVRATRRTVIAAGMVAALASCRFGPGGESASPAGSTPDADAQLLQDAVAALAVQLSLLEAVGRAHLGLATALQPVTEAHRAHLDLLSADEATPTPEETLPPRVPSSAARALAQVRAAEDSLQHTAAELAIAASSGTLARALASISASAAQHLSLLPTVAGGPG